MKWQNNRAILVQFALLLISQPRSQNHSTISICYEIRTEILSKSSFLDQNQQPLHSAESFERILRA